MLPPRGRTPDHKDSFHARIAQALQQNSLSDHSGRAENDDIHLLTSCFFFQSNAEKLAYV
jgi:hypothetical protein